MTPSTHILLHVCSKWAKRGSNGKLAIDYPSQSDKQDSPALIAEVGRRPAPFVHL
jgi:hypothetical protein